MRAPQAGAGFGCSAGILRRMAAGLRSNLTLRHARAVVEPVRVDASMEAVIAAFCGRRCPAILETSLRSAHGRGISIFACEPVDEFIHTAMDAGCPFARFAAHAAQYPHVEMNAGGLPFVGGWIGYFSYEAGLTVEGLRTRKQMERVFPAAHWYLYDSAAVYDHAAEQWYAVAIDLPELARRLYVPVREKVARVKAQLVAAARLGVPLVRHPPCAHIADVSFADDDAGRDSREDGCEKGFTHQQKDRLESRSPMLVGSAHPTYAAAFQKAMAYIEAGDIYQVNLTQRYEVETTATPLETYLRLREISPSPYASFLPWEEGAIISASPELFLELRDGRVVTRPIKGTRGRGADVVEDFARRAELENSEKDRAELNMIIDLLRNDLGRVSRYGTVRVVNDGAIETHPTVFQRVATVTGGLRDGVGVAELLRATMPGGSVTGCPKIRAMQIIDELEPHSREVYCGTVGMIGLDGTMTLNLAIRTMLQRGNTVFVYAGGAVVADSTVEGEYREIETKAGGMLRALGAER